MFVNGGLHDVQHTTNCAELWDNWEAYTPEIKDKLRLFALSSMDAMRNFFFWCVSRSLPISGYES